jgi:hypothetical protein
MIKVDILHSSKKLPVSGAQKNCVDWEEYKRTGVCEKIIIVLPKLGGGGAIRV